MNKHVFLILALLSATAWASQNSGTAGMQFLRLGPDARGNSLAESAVAEASGLEALYWNPAGIQAVERREILLTYDAWIAGITYVYGAFGMPILSGKWGAVAAGISFLDEGNLDQTPEDAETFGKLGTRDLCFSAGYGVKFGRLNIGAALRYVSRDLLGHQLSGITADLGAQFRIGSGFSAGIAGRNLGFSGRAGTTSEPMPAVLQAGLGYRIEFSGQNLGATSSCDLAADAPPVLKAGLEYGLKKMLFLRIGYKYDASGAARPAGSGLSLGLGVFLDSPSLPFKRTGIDLCWVMMGDLGNSIQATMYLSF